MDFQMMLIEEDIQTLSPHKGNEEDDGERQTNKKKDRKTVESDSQKDGSMEEIKGLLNHILKETSGNSEMVKQNSLRIDSLFARNQFIPLGEFPPQQAPALGLPMTSTLNRLPTGNALRGTPTGTNQTIPIATNTSKK